MLTIIQESFINNVLSIIKQDHRINGVAVGGSFITHEMDVYSDVDFIIAVKDEYYDEMMKERVAFVNQFGHILSSFTGEHVGEHRLLICLYGPELLHVDFKFVSMMDISRRVEDPVILWQKDQCLSNAFKLEPPVYPEQGIQWIEDRFWVWIHYGLTKVARGELFVAIDFINAMRSDVIGPLILKKNNRRPSGVRRIEFDAPEYIELLKETIPTYSKESCLYCLKKIIKLYEELRVNFEENLTVKREECRWKVIEYMDNYIETKELEKC